MGIIKKKCGVVMLPTNEKSNIGDFVLGITNGEFPQRLSYGKKVQEPVNCSQTNYHLYILSDGEIKEGDWCYHKPSKEVIKYPCGGFPEGHALKIIATSDNTLQFAIDKSPYPLEIHSLPKIPQSFIEHFVSEYNKGNNITNIMVEYEEITVPDMTVEEADRFVDTLKVNPKENTIFISKIKDSWSREELANIITIYLETAFISNIQGYQNPQNWVEANL